VLPPLHSTPEAATTPYDTSPRAAQPPRARRIPDWATLTVTSLVLIVFAVWMISPRFSIPGPSLLDDWSNVDNAKVALDELVRFSYDPSEAHDTRRYRPGYTAVWNSLQWRTLGGPESMTGPNFWAIVRLALFVAALVAMAGVAVRACSSRLHPAALAVWAAIPAAMMVATPGMALDLARLGPVEPILFAGMAAGLALALASTRRLLEAGRARPLWLLAFAGGYFLWLLGVYHKEASICALALFPFLYVFLDRRWRLAEVVTGPLYRSRGFQIAAAFLVLPLFHMLYEIRHATEGGETVYGTDVPSGLGGWATTLWDSAQMQGAYSGQLGTFAWLGVAGALPFLVLAWILGRRRVPWLPLGLIAAGIAVFLFQGLGGVPATRYYIPVAALLATAAVALLTRGPRWIQVAAIAMVMLFLGDNVDKARDGVQTLANEQEAGIAAVADVARLNPARCPVYMALFHAEEADAFPELVALQDDVEPRHCDPRFKGIMIQGRTPSPPVTNEAIYATCAGKGWEKIRTAPVLVIYGCRRFEKRPVYNQPPEDVLLWNRLVPGKRFSERIHSLPDRALCKAMECRQPLDRLRETYR
jgi:hypothetical protein